MRRLSIAVVAALMLLTACQATQEAEAEIMLGMPNPFREFSVQEEAEEHVSFSFNVPQPSGYTLRVYRVIQDELVEVIYDGASELRIRKGTGSEDISGDYNVYPEKRIVAVKSAIVTIEGSDGKVSKAVWTDGDYAYSITADAPVDELLVIAMIEETY